MTRTDRTGSIVDELADEAARIEKWLTEHEIKQLAAWIQPGAATLTIHWSSESEDGVPDWKAFLAQAKALQAPFVAVRVQRLTAEEWESERLAASDEPAETLALSETQDLLERTRGHIGEVGAIELQWIAPGYNGVLFSLDMSADWFDEFCGRDDDVANHGEPRKRDRSNAELKKLAAGVAHSPEYELCTDYGERQDVARRLVPPDVTDNEDDLYRVMSIATDIFEKEILPKLRKSPEVIELSIKLANDSRFQRASNQQARRYAAEQILPSSVLEHGTKLKLILDRARTIYDVDLRKGKRSSH